MERVSFKYADSPIIFVAPHGHKSDDYNTNQIARIAADHIGANYLINNGWERGKNIDENNSIADCNNVNHLVGVVEDEFLTPYKRMCIRLLKRYDECIVIFVHGVSDSVRKRTGCSNLDMIFGYGDGSPPSMTCSIAMRNKILYELSADKLNCFVGKAGGDYSGWSKNNLNQYWRKHERRFNIESFQLEIIRELRNDDIISELTARVIGDAVKNAYNYKKFNLPMNFIISYI
jgi:hypothetical protein